MSSSISQETKAKALQIAKATQKPGQTKEQTKLIAQGIEKGISEYKKQQKIKARERDKQRKQTLKNKKEYPNEMETQPSNGQNNPYLNVLPWSLLLLSWAAFFIYLYKH